MSTKTLEQKVLLVHQHREALERQAKLEKNHVLSAKIGLERLYVGSQMPSGWMVYAGVLKRAADAVIAEYEKLLRGTPFTGFMFRDLDNVYLYLMGAAVENLLKGIYVARCPELIKLVKEPIYKGTGKKSDTKETVTSSAQNWGSTTLQNSQKVPVSTLPMMRATC